MKMGKTAIYMISNIYYISKGDGEKKSSNKRTFSHFR